MGYYWANQKVGRTDSFSISGQDKPTFWKKPGADYCV